MGTVLEEEGYKEQREQEVRPYNKARETERYVERTAGEPLHLAAYTADEAKGSVVISHGFTESVVKYQEVIYHFLKAGYHVFMAEHCGHGRSYRLNDDPSLVHVDSYQRYVRDLVFVARMCKEEHPDLPMYLYAHSMGGGIGACTIAMEPELFDKAVLTSPMIRPLTGGIPWSITKLIASVMNLAGKGGDYVMGQKPYDGTADFETSCYTSRARFDYYTALVKEDVHLQTCACSYSWIREAVRMNEFLRTQGYKQVRIPVMLFQAELDTLVSGSEQENFIRKIAAYGKSKAVLVKVPGVKHEIFDATKELQEKYWKKVFAFFASGSPDKE